MANSLINKLDAQFQTGLEIGARIGFQRACDAISVMLNSPDIMGAKGVMSGEKINTIIEAASKYDSDYFNAFKPKNAEADYQQELRDRDQRHVFKGKAVSFYERYPELKRIKY